MELIVEKLTLLDIAVGMEAHEQSEIRYRKSLERYLTEETWGDIQAYFELRNWNKYYQTLSNLEKSSRAIGAIVLAEELEQLKLAAKAENPYYIMRHQSGIMERYQELLDQLEEVLGQGNMVPKTETEWNAHILVVDDDKKSLEEAKRILGKQFRVSLAESAAIALDLIRKEVPDILLIDVYMPETDGFEMLELLQDRADLKNIPVVFLTTEYNRMMEARGFKAGAQDFITKPFLKEIVIQRVRRILELSRLQNNLQKEVLKQTRQAEERRRQVERLTDQIINALADTIDAKDSYTNGHSRRVAEYSLEIAKRAGKSEEEQERIYYMGMLHDIGKIGIPDSIITKNSGLSDKEYFVTRKHPEIGAEILANISEIPDLGVGAHWHHERYDGTGYPDGLKGTEIPEEARLIAVADAYDAMASKRSYRDVLPQKTVYEEIKKGRETQFDPFFADIMLELMREDKNYDMREK